MLNFDIELRALGLFFLFDYFFLKKSDFNVKIYEIVCFNLYENLFLLDL